MNGEICRSLFLKYQLEAVNHYGLRCNIAVDHRLPQGRESFSGLFLGASEVMPGDRKRSKAKRVAWGPELYP